MRALLRVKCNVARGPNKRPKRASARGGVAFWGGTERPSVPSNGWRRRPPQRANQGGAEMVTNQQTPLPAL